MRTYTPQELGSTFRESLSDHTITDLRQVHRIGTSALGAQMASEQARLIFRGEELEKFEAAVHRTLTGTDEADTGIIGSAKEGLARLTASALRTFAGQATPDKDIPIIIHAKPHTRAYNFGQTPSGTLFCNTLEVRNGHPDIEHSHPLSTSTSDRALGIRSIRACLEMTKANYDTDVVGASLGSLGDDAMNVAADFLDI